MENETKKLGEETQDRKDSEENQQAQKIEPTLVEITIIEPKPFSLKEKETVELTDVLVATRSLERFFQNEKEDEYKTLVVATTKEEMNRFLSPENYVHRLLRHKVITHWDDTFVGLFFRQGGIQSHPSEISYQINKSMDEISSTNLWESSYESSFSLVMRSRAWRATVDLFAYRMVFK